jgi:hypothetical protein
MVRVGAQHLVELLGARDVDGAARMVHPDVIGGTRPVRVHLRDGLAQRCRELRRHDLLVLAAAKAAVDVTGPAVLARPLQRRDDPGRDRHTVELRGRVLEAFAELGAEVLGVGAVGACDLLRGACVGVSDLDAQRGGDAVVHRDFVEDAESLADLLAGVSCRAAVVTVVGDADVDVPGLEATAEVALELADVLTCEVWRDKRERAFRGHRALQLMNRVVVVRLGGGSAQLRRREAC